MNWSGCDLVEVIPGKVSGRPLVRGTRIIADTIVGDFELGSSIAEIKENYPALSVESIEKLIQFASRRQ